MEVLVPEGVIVIREPPFPTETTGLTDVVGVAVVEGVGADAEVVATDDVSIRWTRKEK